MSWAEDIVGEVDFGDGRLRCRLLHLMDDWCRQPGASIPQATGSWAGSMAAYRFFDNAAVDRVRLVEAMAAVTARRCREMGPVVVIQDTTSLDYTHHPHTIGLGMLDNEHARGLLVHTSMAVSDAGVPLGVVAQDVWARENHPERSEDWRHQVPIEAKESVKWLDGLRQSQARLEGCGRVVTVADREADVFEVFGLAQELDGDWVIRARHDRVVADGLGHLVATVESVLAGEETTVTVTCAGGHRTRRARTQVRWTQVQIVPPEERAKKDIAAWWAAHPTIEHRVSVPLTPVRVGVVLVTEVDPPSGEPALRWLLLTSLPVETDADALRCVRYYQMRWLIERFHFVLKSGCRIERLQLADAVALGRALAVLSGVAWHLLALTLEAREHPATPCTTVVSTQIWQALWATQSPQLPFPTEPPDLRSFVRAVARLGGFLARRRDGEPGVTTLWRGFTRLNDLTAAYWTGRIHARSPPDGPTCV
jgi:hypothetical protein